MWKKTAPLLVILSVALNLAFIGVWAAHAAAARWNRGSSSCGPDAGSHGAMWCPLHRKLGTTDQQWQQIEPKLAEFRKSAQAVCQDVAHKRGEMIDLIATTQPDRQAIAAKQDEILAGQRKMQELVIEQLLSEKQVLTPQQQKELFDLLRQRGGCAGHGPMMMGLPGGEGTTCPHQDGG
jgi:Spy/CpxP family protein refolding chaperone